MWILSELKISILSCLFKKLVIERNMNMKALGSILVLQWMVLEIIITQKARGHKDLILVLIPILNPSAETGRGLGN